METQQPRNLVCFSYTPEGHGGLANLGGRRSLEGSSLRLQSFERLVLSAHCQHWYSEQWKAFYLSVMDCLDRVN